MSIENRLLLFVIIILLLFFLPNRLLTRRVNEANKKTVNK